MKKLDQNEVMTEISSQVRPGMSCIMVILSFNHIPENEGSHSGKGSQAHNPFKLAAAVRRLRKVLRKREFTEILLLCLLHHSSCSKLGHNLHMLRESSPAAVSIRCTY